ncbi:MAG: PIN domain nuclease, partial [Aphanizomenon gracile PMC644.10]|nr:PIN domain nuclease [Aphanizomenon gracile PMC644.10]
MIYLLDTDTCIYWIKNINSVRDKIQQIGWEQISICNITVAELYFGAYNSQKVAENL